MSRVNGVIVYKGVSKGESRISSYSGCVIIRRGGVCVKYI